MVPLRGPDHGERDIYYCGQVIGPCECKIEGLHRREFDLSLCEFEGGCHVVDPVALSRTGHPCVGWAAHSVACECCWREHSGSLEE
eukprot:1264695-Alexandrium_andersonii.AAC.1